MLTNLFRDFPSTAQSFKTLLSRPNLRLERIVSGGQVMLVLPNASRMGDSVAGAAGLQLEGESGERKLYPDVFVDIPSGCCHRVNWTDTNDKTVWLAVHYGDVLDET